MADEIGHWIVAVAVVDATGFQHDWIWLQFPPEQTNSVFVFE